MSLQAFFAEHVLPRRLPSVGQPIRLYDDPLCVHTPSTLVLFLEKVNSAQLVATLKAAEKKGLLGEEVLLVCQSVSALRSTFKTKASEFDIRITVLSASPSDTHFHHPLAYGCPFFDLPQVPQSVRVLPNDGKQVDAAIMKSDDPLALAFGIREGQRVEIVERVGCDIENNQHGTFASNPVSVRQVVMM